jgi:CRP-like cAMP-binding protein
MAMIKTSELHARAASAQSKGDFAELLRLAGEIVRISPSDFRARIMVARALGGLGHESEAAEVHGANCTALLQSGFDFTAIEVCNESLKNWPGEFSLYHSLGEVYDAIGGKEPSIKARSLPPPPLVEVDNDSPGSLLRFTDASLLVKQAHSLAIQPTRTPSQTRPKYGVPFFSGLGRDAFVNLVSEIERRTLTEGEILFDEGAPGDSLYVLLSGSVQVTRKDALLATLPAGSVFGEMALITGEARTAKVAALKPSSVFVVHVDDVEKVAVEYPEITGNIVQFARRRMLMNVVSTSSFFNPLSQADRLDLLKLFATKVIQKAQILMDEGDHPSGLYVVANGTLEVSKKDDNGDQTPIAELHEGEVLGEIALVRDIVTTARVTAKTKTVVLFLNRSQFTHVIETHPELREYLETISESRFQETDELMSLEAEELCASEIVMV